MMRTDNTCKSRISTSRAEFLIARALNVSYRDRNREDRDCRSCAINAIRVDYLIL